MKKHLEMNYNFFVFTPLAEYEKSTNKLYNKMMMLKEGRKYSMPRLNC